MLEPLVSIITPSYNQGKFVEGCILSIKKQSYPNIEHIIVDGKSEDNTIEILKRHKGTYNMRWISKKDKGMYFAINKGIKMARGEVIAYLNCDDSYFPWSVKAAVEKLLSLENPDIVYGDMVTLKLQKRRKAVLNFYPPFNARYYETAGVLGQPTVFLKKDVFTKHGLFNTTYKLIADCEYWLRVSRGGGKIEKIHEFLAIGRDHERTQRETQRETMLKEWNRLRDSYSGARKLTYFTYRFYPKLYYRYYLLRFLLTRSGWPYFRASKLMDGKYRYLVGELLPRPLKLGGCFVTESDISGLYAEG